MKDNNCYETCDYYFYFDLNKYHCTENKMCPEKYNKLIINQSRCIDNCQNENIYKYEYNNICLEECPLNTSSNENNFICTEKKNEEIKTDYIPKIQTEYILKIQTEYIPKIQTEYIPKIQTDYIPKIQTDYIPKIKTEIIINFQDEFLEDIQEKIQNGLNISEIDGGNNIIYTKDNIIYTITSTSNQRNNRNISNASSIDLGDCEDKLKYKYNISKNANLYILKIDAIIGNMNKLEYEVYYPFSANNLTKLDLVVCKNMKVDITIPIYIPPNELYKYNKSNALYNDICYTSENDSEIYKPLKDRQDEFVNNNISVCEEDCDLISYNIKTNESLCSCFIKLKLPLISEIKIDKEKMFSNFKNIKNIANLKLLKCYYLIFLKSNIIKNSANYIVAILIILSIISIFVFICHDYINNIRLINLGKRRKIIKI